MSDQKPSERAMDCASEWQGHQFSCAIYGDCELPDSACTCIVRKLAISIDTAIREAVEAERLRGAELSDAAAAWLAKYDMKEVQDGLTGAFFMAQIHGSKYTGPTWEVELKAMRDALSRRAQEG